MLGIALRFDDEARDVSRVLREYRQPPRAKGHGQPWFSRLDTKAGHLGAGKIQLRVRARASQARQAQRLRQDNRVARRKQNRLNVLDLVAAAAVKGKCAAALRAADDGKKNSEPRARRRQRKRKGRLRSR